MTIQNPNSIHNEQINRANEAVQQTREQMKHAQYRLNYHFMSPVGWLNDPNGLIQHKGIYHLFYQFNPYSFDWGPMHWGHATSTDLVHWKHEPVALAPSEPYEYDEAKQEMGCFSGSAVIHNDELTLIYTGHLEGHTPKEVQAIATSTDGIHFRKHEANPVIRSVPNELGSEFRDPKVWKHEEHWYMVVGTTSEGNGAIVLYKSTDLIDWEYLGIAAKGNGKQGDMWECPDLFPLGDKYVLITSPMNMENGKCTVFVGTLDYNTGIFTPESQREIDYGIDFYAAQTFEDEQGRRILIAWMDFPFTEFPSKAYNWSGAMTIPRILTLDDETQHVRANPIPELQSLRELHTNYDAFEMGANQTVGLNSNSHSHSYELICDVTIPEKIETGRIGLQLRKSLDGSEFTSVYYDIAASEIVIDTTQSGERFHKALNKAPLRKNNQLKFHIFVDTCSVEVFVNNGEVSLSTRIYPELTSNGIELFTENTKVSITSINLWSLKNAEIE